VTISTKRIVGLAPHWFSFSKALQVFFQAHFSIPRLLDVFSITASLPLTSPGHRAGTEQHWLLVVGCICPPKLTHLKPRGELYVAKASLVGMGACELVSFATKKRV
jgi:hypothetical protein